jgi:hypothetical protein
MRPLVSALGAAFPDEGILVSRQECFRTALKCLRDAAAASGADVAPAFGVRAAAHGFRCSWCACVTPQEDPCTEGL